MLNKESTAWEIDHKKICEYFNDLVCSINYEDVHIKYKVLAMYTMKEEIGLDCEKSQKELCI